VFGQRIRRVEDPRLLRGRGEYVDDLAAPGALHLAFVRSPYAHATIEGIDDSAARALPGVAVVFTAQQFGASNGPHPHPTWFPPNDALRRAIRPTAHPETIRLLAEGDVRFVGEPVAVVAATDRYLAEDAARLVEVTYDPLPANVDPERALDLETPLVQPDRGTNLALHFTVTKGEPERAFDTAAHVVSATVRMARQTGVPIEPRGSVAVPDRRDGLTVWSSNQAPHWLRDAIMRCLGVKESRLRVLAPDVGGGFGVKSMVYPEELVVAELARRLGRPVRWMDTRRESFLTAVQSRDQRHELSLALDADGRILGLRDRYLVDGGASNVENLIVPYNTTSHLQGMYRIPSLEAECTVVLTNKAPLSAYRGAGRPEAIFALDRILDRAARALAMDPAELRRRNILTAEEMPYDAGILYRDGRPLVLDAGDFRGALDAALEAAGYDAFRAEQQAARTADDGGPGSRRHIGIGIGTYIEGTGVGPFETARVRLTGSGDAVVTTALPSQGQGHETSLGQLVGDALGLPLERISLQAGDTLTHPWGGGTIASRTAVVVGSAVDAAAREVRALAAEVASERLEVSVDDLVFADGRVHVAGSPDRGLELGALAASAAPGIGRQATPGGIGLQAEAAFAPETVTFASGVHVAVVEVDPVTGAVKILRYVVVHDCGRVINPLIVEGQIQGGIAQGIGGAMFERLVYDPDGQLVNGTLMDYGLPRASDVPDVEMHHQETPSERNPLGVRGVGEAGTIAVPSAVIGAVEDALAPLGLELNDCPVLPETLSRALGEARRPAIAGRASRP
jgi:carbon-monoxide dehydrogenase large subunit